MFKFLHCADLHLDSPMRGLAAKPDAPVDEIRAATRRALDNMVAICLKESIRFVLMAGDVFDGEWQDYNTGLFFNSRMAKLNQQGIQVYLVQGNHDAASKISRDLVLPPNVLRFSAEQPETVTIEEIGVAIHGQGFQTRDVRDNLALNYPVPRPGYLNIGLLHTAVQGQVGHAPYAPCKIDDLLNKGYDYWALGHVHQRQILHRDPYIVYPGNIQGRHIREQGRKGGTIVTVDRGRVTEVAEVDLDVLRWTECVVDLAGAMSNPDFVARVGQALQQCGAEHSGYPLAVRLRLSGQTELHDAITADQDKYRMEIENSINIAISDPVWVEKVKFETRPVQAAQLVDGQRDSLAAVRQTAAALLDEDPLIQDFIVHSQSVLTNMSGYARSPEAKVVNSAADVRLLLADAQELLQAKLTQGGGR